MRRFSWLFLFIISLSAASYAQNHQDWTYNQSIYEVNVRQYTSEGTFNAFRTHLDRLEELDAGIFWFMPIHPIGQQNRLGSRGSYYSVQDYLEVNPNFGTMEDFKSLVDDMHSRGMYIILDWVANHTSWDNVLTESNPEWYVTNNSGEFTPPPGTNWSDVIQLDHSQPGLRAYMIEALRFWVDSVGVDGFRFDAVDFVPDNFWSEVVDSLRATRSDLFLLAESNEEKYFDLGFDMSFAWDLYGFEQGVLLDIAKGTSDAGALSRYAAFEKDRTAQGEYRMYFTSNHDINSWEGTTTELFGSYAEAFAVLTGTFHSMPLIYSGQEAGLNKRLSFFDKDLIPWQDHPNFELYKTLFHLKKTNKALWNGRSDNFLLRILSSNNSRVFAFIREYEDDRIFAAFNLWNSELNVFLSGEDFTGTYTNVFTGEEVILEKGASINLPPYGYVLYELETTETSAEEEFLPAGFDLHQNYPNPFNPSTIISYQLVVNSRIRLSVYDLLGREVATLVDGAQAAGEHRATFDASDLSGGVYIYRLTGQGFSQTRQMVLIK